MLAACCALLLLALAPIAEGGGEGAAPRDFTLRRGNGEEVNLASLRGNVVVVVFWATWCPYCKRLLPGIQKLADFYQGEKLKVLAVDVWDDGDIDVYRKKYGLTLDVLLKGDQVAEQWGVRGTPTVFVLDAEGNLILRTSNSDPDDPELADAIDTALKNLKSTAAD